MAEHSRRCPKCDTMLSLMIMNDQQELVALKCNYCSERLNIDRKEPRILSLNRAGLLSDLIRAVERSNKQSGVTLRWYPFGARFEPEFETAPANFVLRAFTHDGGGFLSEDEDVRDAYVWCSGTFERWLKVEEVLDALDNATTGRHGMDKPMAMIDYNKEV